MYRFKNKKLIISVVILLMIAASVAVLAVTSKHLVQPTSNTATTQKQTSSAPKEQPKKDYVRIIAAGDMLPHEAINKAAKTGDGYNYAPIMKNMKPYFDKADVRFCVQAVPGGGEKFGITGYPVFNAPLEFTRDMVGLGCNVINTGTNHTNDKGQPLINATLDAWDKYPGLLAVAGANRTAEEQQKIRYFEKDGVKFAFLSYVTYSNTHNATPYGVNMWDETTAARELAEARKQADVIMVSMRWGTEYSPAVNGTQASRAQFLADHGADIVFGHGQHVEGPVKQLEKLGGGKTLVWYGIGNFINAQLDPESLFNGVPVIDVNINTKQIQTVSFLPFYMHYEWTADQKTRQDLLSRKNFMMYTFDQAADPLKRSQNSTTLEAQKKRLSDVLNQFTTVKILEPAQY